MPFQRDNWHLGAGQVSRMPLRHISFKIKHVGLFVFLIEFIFYSITGSISPLSVFITYISSNSIQFFVLYVPTQQLQSKLQTQNSVDTSNYIKDKHNINTKKN
jgi:hypothetical protein